jgi:ribokinase
MVARYEGSSGVAFIYVFEETSENQIIVISGSNELVQSNQISEKELSASDILISQLEIPPSEIEDLFIRAKKSGIYRILNTAPALKISKNLIRETDLLVMNESELENLTERTVERQNADSIGQAIKDLNLSTTQSIVVTLGSKGVYVHANQKGQFIDGHKVEALDTTGSGDCFIGALASQYLESNNLLDSVNFANKAAALSVMKRGASASMPTLEEVVNFQ